MCYSAMIKADYRRYVREWGADIDIHQFVELFWWKWSPEEITRRRSKPNIPKALERAFAHPQTEPEREIARYIRETAERQALEWQQELFAQRTRLVKAEQSLAVKQTKKALEDQRIATDKISRIKTWLDDLTRNNEEERDSRIYPAWFAPVMVWESGRRVVKPMRYQCRPAGRPAFYDTKFPGTYNARRDNLEGFWKGQFGHTHAVMIVDRFFENVDRDGKNVVLEFRPRDGQEMIVACLWSHWTERDEELLSFAAITDEPPPEVAAAGHDRCIIPIRPENVDAWLQPESQSREALQAILDDRPRPYYEHKMAA
jgi:putative SOS response-associated peptidase YedK